MVDGNPERASQVAGFLRGLGYDAQVATTGAQGFAQAAESADVELIVVDPTFVNDPWRLPDLLGNLKADPRTAGIPVFLVGPLDSENQLSPSLESFPDARFLVTPTETDAAQGPARPGVRLARGPAADRRPSGPTTPGRPPRLLAQVARQPGQPVRGRPAGRRARRWRWP